MMMGWEIFAILMGVILALLLIWGVLAIIDIQHYKSLQRKKWESLPKFKIYCDGLYRKEWPYIGLEIMPEALWYSPELPLDGETTEEMKARCKRYNEEYQR